VSARRERDRGLGAVERVREVRDRDSQLGVRQAAVEHEARQRAAERLDATLSEHAAASTVDQGASEFAVRRQALLALASAARRAEQEVAAAERLKAAAQEHWRRDRARLRAVQYLLELRAEAWQAQVDRATARELDDIGSRRWLRGRAEQP
jgi:flagellar FliJ protein